MTHWFITGATGFIGQELIRCVLAQGDRVTGLTRKVTPKHNSQVNWVTDVQDCPQDIDVIVNLAGEGIADRRWSAERKQALRDSRIALTQALVERAASTQVRQVISASAVGFYGAAGVVDESAQQGHGWAAQLCRDWEAVAQEFAAPTAIIRLGVVLGPGGFLNRTLPPFSLGLGGPIGNGAQGFSWIHRQDVIRLILWMVEHQKTGVYNACGPQASTNKQMAQALGAAVNRPAFLPAPGWVLKAVFGQMAEELLLSGQQALPTRALEEGFEFAHPTLLGAMREAVMSKRSGSTAG
ncbi:MAG: TIGR01777 family oxidoreductase [Litorivicinus sp.]